MVDTRWGSEAQGVTNEQPRTHKMAIEGAGRLG
jgi:hypothetical protein